MTHWLLKVLLQSAKYKRSMETSLYSLGLKKHHLPKVWSWKHLGCWWRDVGILHAFKPSYILMPSLGLGAGWDTLAGYDMALKAWESAPLINPKHLIITVRDQYGCFPSKSWAIDFLKSALNEDGDCVRSLFPLCLTKYPSPCSRPGSWAHDATGAPGRVAVSQPCVTRNKSTSECKASLWFSAGFAGELLSFSLSPHFSFLNDSTLAVFFSPSC